MEYTPGPWTLGRNTSSKTVILAPRHLLDPNCKLGTGNEMDLLAACYGDSEIRKNNARLISAALDLLEACKAWMLVEAEMKDNHPCPDPVLRADYRKKAVALTKAAIAKVEGKETQCHKK